MRKIPVGIGSSKVRSQAWTTTSVLVGVIGVGVLAANHAVAEIENAPRYTYNLYGAPGLIDMPTAQSAEDGELSTTVSTFQGQTRTTLSFQITPRLSGSFRYATIDNWSPTGGRTWDRSFDLRYRFIDEGRYRPAVAIGLQDFMGTGLYSSEYIVATKTIGNRLSLTGGIGWGRMGSYNGFTNPLGALHDGFNTRPVDFGLGGKPSFNHWFRGDAALFGGASYAVSDRLTLKAEYSSDAYVGETTRGLAPDRFVHRSPLNFGVDYRVSKGVNLSAAYLYGSVLAVSASFSFNPRYAPNGGSLGPAPLPVKPRPSRQISPESWGVGWAENAAVTSAMQGAISKIMATEGLELEALRLKGSTAYVRFRNLRYEAAPQAVGRTARILTQVLPASVETFQIEPSVEGMTPSTITLHRRDVEQLEFAPNGAKLSYSRTVIKAAEPHDRVKSLPELYPNLTWGIAPYMEVSVFDPDRPITAQVGVEASARVELGSGLSLSGAIRQPVAGNLDTDRVSDSVIQHVRSDSNIYAKADGPLIDRLTFDYFFQPGKNLYGRVSAGYLEQMYGGVSTELLWKPVDSRLALGAELNYVKQRDFDQLFGFQDYDTVTGHASAYYDFGNGFHGQVDVGRYLAEDWGATFTLDREFANGWKVGAYFTLTNVPFEDFGEGSFDKGLRLTIPVSWAIGRPSRRNVTTTIKSLSRDGGARLDIDNRLYEKVREWHDPSLETRWGRFWR